MRLLRRGIPVVIVVMVGATMLVSWLDPLKVLVKLPIDAGKLVVSGTRITMQAPKLSGFTKDHRWYEVTAIGATQDITKPDVIELAAIRAKLEASDKSTLQLESRDGLFNRKNSLLTLHSGVTVKSTSGYEIQLDEVRIDTTKGDAVSDKPVFVKTQNGTLTSERMEIERSGEVIHFIGNVIMDLQPIDKQKQGDGALAARSPAPVNEARR